MATGSSLQRTASAKIYAACSSPSSDVATDCPAASRDVRACGACLLHFDARTRSAPGVEAPRHRVGSSSRGGCRRVRDRGGSRGAPAHRARAAGLTCPRALARQRRSARRRRPALVLFLAARPCGGPARRRSLPRSCARARRGRSLWSAVTVAFMSSLPVWPTCKRASRCGSGCAFGWQACPSRWWRRSCWGLLAGGRLRLWDTVGRLLPGLLPAAGQITVMELLEHRSGLADYLASRLRSLGGAALYDRLRFGDVWTPRRLLGLVAKLPLQFAPGTQFA